MEERIQKIIANSGYCSRRKAEELIKDKKVVVDGKVVETGFKLEKENAKITINGEKLKTQDKKYYFALNKPKGILVTKDDPQKRKTIYSLPSLKKLNLNLNYVGRLDGTSEGLLLLTNDGELTNNLTHPSKKITKEYHLRTEPTLKKEDITKAKSGIMIDKQMFFGKIKNQKKNEFTIEITEGRNRILRRIFEDKLKYKIYMLKRIKIKNLKLGNLKVGEVRELSEDEVNDLKNS
ncbi:rRNA pseudouridine synthase [archaeon]|mgnify:CR=1 FL=1|jgi:23S rRNA pseudouridine2605 synthase|nr:rRNA pseudouridine synthase [archaeon]MBT6182353.1 rRNA pseudouridine synthase [archaeon]MBT6606482.1 rRNA pseudouridine synthase [archaeon]MBT7660657.1 rRNA pseudouridine synthase [archaeon]